MIASKINLVATACLFVAAGFAGCVGHEGDASVDDTSPQTARPDGPIFEGEKLEGNVTVTTFYVAAHVVLDGFDYFDVASRTRNVTMNPSWSETLSEVQMCVGENEYYAEYDCTSTQGGEAKFTMFKPRAGAYLVRFFADTGAASGSYTIEVTHEIWPDD